MDQAPLGNKAPSLGGYAPQIWCPACRGLLQKPLALTSGHVFTECMVVEGTCKCVGNSGDFVFYSLSRYQNPWRNKSFPWWLHQGWIEWKISSLPVCEWDGFQGGEGASPGSPTEGSKPIETYWDVVELLGGGGECWSLWKWKYCFSFGPDAWVTVESCLFLVCRNVYKDLLDSWHDQSHAMFYCDWKYTHKMYICHQSEIICLYFPTDWLKWRWRW